MSRLIIDISHGTLVNNLLTNQQTGISIQPGQCLVFNCASIGRFGAVFSKMPPFSVPGLFICRPCVQVQVSQGS